MKRGRRGKRYSSERKVAEKSEGKVGGGTRN